MELINLTALAKINRGTTPATRAKLEKLGINPAQEVEIPSGRKFVLFDKVKAVKAIEKSRADREKAQEKKAAAVAKKASKAVVKSKPSKADPVQQELRALRETMTQLLEHFTQPQQQASQQQGNPASSP
jgi:hypothetical protein